MEPKLSHPQAFSLQPGVYTGSWKGNLITIQTLVGKRFIPTLNVCKSEKHCTVHIDVSHNVFVKCESSPDTSQSSNPSFSIRDTMTVDHGGWEQADDPDGFLRKAAEKRKKLSEALTIPQRLKRRMVMRRSRNKILMAKKRAAKRKATPDVLKKRAIRGARNILTKKFLKKKPSEATYGERVRVEKILKTKTVLVNRIAKKLYPILRKKEAERYEKQVASPADK